MTRRIAGFRATAKLLTVLFDIFQGLAQKVRVVNYLRIYLRILLKLGREISAFFNDQFNNDNVMHILKSLPDFGSLCRASVCHKGCWMN